MNPFRRLIPVFFLCILISGLKANPVSAKTVSECVNGAKIAVASNGNRVTVKWRGKKYWTFRLAKAKIRFVSEGKLTRHMLLSRKAKHIVYVERIVGKVVNSNMDGLTTNGHYMSYRSLRGYAHKGDEVATYCVYNPFSNAIDDVIDRFDVVL